MKMEKLLFAYFDFMHERGWLSPRGRIRDCFVATLPAWIFLGVALAAVYLLK